MLVYRWALLLVLVYRWALLLVLVYRWLLVIFLEAFPPVLHLQTWWRFHQAAHEAPCWPLGPGRCRRFFRPHAVGMVALAFSKAAVFAFAKTFGSAVFAFTKAFAKAARSLLPFASVFVHGFVLFPAIRGPVAVFAAVVTRPFKLSASTSLFTTFSFRFCSFEHHGHEHVHLP